MRSDIERIDDILKAIARIESLHSMGEERFKEDVLVQEAMIFNFQVLGEAANGVSIELRSLHPEIDWSELIAFRNVLVHQYWRIMIEVVWTAAEEYIPELKPKIEAIAAIL